jgi:MOSC domain-containing protein YiiM
MKILLDSIPQTGRVEWIGVRPVRRLEPVVVDAVEADPKTGLTGDHYTGGANGKRQVTLIQAEHLTAVAAMLELGELDPARVRRNIVVRGINLLALHNRTFRMGEVLLEGTGYCHPCSRMEENLGPGGYNAMRGHGGITARVLKSGTIYTGDAVSLVV